MDCPICHRSNKIGLVNCDYCGTALTGPAPTHRVSYKSHLVDPFRPPTAGPPPGAGGGAAASLNTTRRIIGWLVTFDGNSDGVSHVLREGRNVIGSTAENDVVIPSDDTVSSTHAFLLWRAGRARVADANTPNGTYVNEEDVLGQVEVKDNDVIRVGRTRFLILLLDYDRVTTLWKLPATISNTSDIEKELVQFLEESKRMTPEERVMRPLPRGLRPTILGDLNEPLDEDELPEVCR